MELNPFFISIWIITFLLKIYRIFFKYFFNYLFISRKITILVLRLYSSNNISKRCNLNELLRHFHIFKNVEKREINNFLSLSQKWPRVVGWLMCVQFVIQWSVTINRRAPMWNALNWISHSKNGPVKCSPPFRYIYSPPNWKDSPQSSTLSSVTTLVPHNYSLGWPKFKSFFGSKINGFCYGKL